MCVCACMCVRERGTERGERHTWREERGGRRTDGNGELAYSST